MFVGPSPHAIRYSHRISAGDEETILGSLSAITGRDGHSSALPDWLEEGTDPSLRESEQDPKVVVAPTPIQRLKGSSQLGSPAMSTPSASPMGSPMPNVGSKGPLTDLDKFYADDYESEGHTSSAGDEGGFSEEDSGSEDHDDSEDEHSEDSP